MGKKFDIELALRGKDEGAGSLMEKTARNLKLLHKEAAASGESLLHRAVKETAEGGPDAMLELIGGGKLALAGLLLDKLGESANKVMEKFGEARELHLGVGATVAELAKGLPVLGTWFEFGQRLREEWDGTAEQLREMERDTEKQKKNLEIVLELDRQIHAMNVQISHSIAAAGEALEDPFLQRLGEIGRHFDDVNEQLEEMRRKARDIGNPEQRRQEQDRIANLAGRNELDKKAREDAVFADQQRASDRLGRSLEGQGKDADSRTTEGTLLGQGRFLDAQIEAARRAGEEKKRALDEQEQQAKDAGTATYAQQLEFDGLREKNAWETEQKIWELRKEASRQGLAAESELRQKNLESQGDHLAAQIEQINQSYEERIRLAKTVGEKEALGFAQGRERQDAILEQKKSDKLLQLDRERREAMKDVDEHSAPGRIGVEWGRGGFVAGTGSHAEQMKTLAELQVKKLDRLIEVVEKSGTPGGIPKEAVRMIQVKR